MATSHSFLPDHLTAATPKRVASPPPQLPLPQSLTGTSGSAPSSPRQSTNAATALNRHSNYFITSLSPSPRTLPSDSQPFSSYLPTTPCSTRRHPALSSFFRPARPDQQQHRYSVTESLYRSSQDAHTADGYQLGDLATKRLSTSSSDAGQPDSTVEGLGQMQFSTLKRLKQSREPLLPIAGKPSQSAAPRISMSEEQAGRGSKVRSSLERVFSLRRGMSFESIRNPRVLVRLLQKEDRRSRANSLMKNVDFTPRLEENSRFLQALSVTPSTPPRPYHLIHRSSLYLPARSPNLRHPHPRPCFW
ncbi:Eukaryotic peptide chain release factor GTP-binding [Salix suchowensis]|nr:Eukaryotic peptide chain release factor GTP-binding [Salix suchowensis]